MTTEVLGTRRSTGLERRIEAHRADLPRLRAKYGDPEEALFAFVRKHFDEEALVCTYQEYLRDPHLGDEADSDRDI